MIRIFLLITIIFSLSLFAEMIVIANKTFPSNKLEKNEISKIYLGKVFIINQISILPTILNYKNLKVNFFKEYLNMTNDQYEAYWIVKLYIGRGTTKVKEFTNIDDIMDFIRNNEGAIAFIDKDLLNNKLYHNYKIILEDK